MMIWIIAGGILLTTLLTFLLFKHIGLYHKLKKVTNDYEEQIKVLEKVVDRNRFLLVEQSKIINELCDRLEDKESE